jgi:anaerobic carbon-monoxide dehydrogenase iron sulfur subunit
MQENISNKVLLVDPFKCDGCRKCETACAQKHAGNRKIGMKRIDVMGTGDGNESFFVPSTCRQCVEPPCMAVCPKSAIGRDHRLERTVIDTKLCVGCAMCVSACPSGSMTFAHDLGLPYKCDLCDGDPQCVGVCEKKALEYVESNRLHYPRVRQSARAMLGGRCRPTDRMF